MYHLVLSLLTINHEKEIVGNGVNKSTEARDDEEADDVGPKLHTYTSIHQLLLNTID